MIFPPKVPGIHRNIGDLFTGELDKAGQEVEFALTDCSINFNINVREFSFHAQKWAIKRKASPKTLFQSCVGDVKSFIADIQFVETNLEWALGNCTGINIACAEDIESLISDIHSVVSDGSDALSICEDPLRIIKCGEDIKGFYDAFKACISDGEAAWADCNLW